MGARRKSLSTLGMGDRQSGLNRVEQNVKTAVGKIRCLDVQKDRHGVIKYCYFRRDGKRSEPLPLPIGSPEFWAAYLAVANGQNVPAAVAAERTRQGSLKPAIALYLESATFIARVPAEATRARQISTLNSWVRADGDMPLAALDRKRVIEMLDAIELPNPRRTFLITIREFCKWAVDKEMLPVDPTAGIIVKLPKTDGHHTIEDDQVTRFLARWPLGSQEHLLFALLLYTGQRCSDVRRLGPQHIRDGAFHIKQKKTGVHVAIPVAPALRRAIEACPSKHLTFLATPQGKPCTQKAIDDMFRSACTAAGLPTSENGAAKADRCVPHGLRKAFCRRLADLGVPPMDIAALSGHLSLKEVMRYTEKYDRKSAGKRSMAKLVAAGLAA